MKQRKPVYVYDSLIDYKGVERPFTLCGIVISHKDEISRIDEDTLLEAEINPSMVDELLIGFSIVKSSDLLVRSKELGEKIALGKTLKRPNYYVWSGSGILSSFVIEAILKQEAMYLKENPERYLIGYNKEKIKYNQSAKKD